MAAETVMHNVLRVCLDPLPLLEQALAVSKGAHHFAGSRADEYWGIRVLLERVRELVEVTTVQKDNEEAFDVASNALGGALSLIGQYNNDAVDDQMLYTIETMLALAKKHLDEEWFALEQAGTEVQHG
jgi:hypothetical protein